MNIEPSVLFGFIGALIGIIGVISTFKKTNKEEGMQNAETRTQLSYISKGVDDIRIDLKSQASKLDSFQERLIINEQSTKQAHKRIDNLEHK